MKIPLSQKLIQKIRKSLPLSVRQSFGPYAARVTFSYHKITGKKKPKVLSLLNTLHLIDKEKLSMVRFGDGEITLIEGNGLGFQEKNNELAERLEAIVRSNERGLLICVPGIWGDLSLFLDYARHFILHHLFRNGYLWDRLLSQDVTYGDAYITRPYLSFKEKTGSEEIFKKFFSLWDRASVVLVEGSKSRIGVGNNMLENAATVERILCPAENAYSQYEQIKNEVLKQDKNKLILVALGPTAKVLTYDLFKLGYRVLDIGHLDMEYEMFVRRENVQVKISYKYFNEINARNPEDCLDEKYLSEIIATID